MFAKRFFYVCAGLLGVLLVASVTIGCGKSTKGPTQPTPPSPPVFQLGWGSFGNGNDQFANPIGVVADQVGNVYVADLNNNRVQQFTGCCAPILGQR